MERLTLRSTSLLGLQAELRQQDLLNEARESRIGRTGLAAGQRRRSLFGLRLPGFLTR